MNSVPKILVIEDEAPIRRFLKAGLGADEYELIEAETGKEGILKVSRLNPDIVLLDLGLPDLDGLSVTKQIREWSDVPIIVISARGQEQDKIAALDQGANDYLTKPFSMGELLARIRVSLRLRKAKDACSPAVFEAGRILVDFAAHKVFVNHNEVHLTPLEFKLLATLVKEAGKVLTHKYLLTNVWGPSYTKETHYLRVFMKELRHKLEQDPTQPQYLTTEPGVGYRFCLPE